MISVRMNICEAQLAMDALVAVVHRDLALRLDPGEHALGIAFADAFKRLTGQDVKKPGLCVH